jgi:hypothetical protein
LLTDAAGKDRSSLKNAVAALPSMQWVRAVHTPTAAGWRTSVAAALQGVGGVVVESCLARLTTAPEQPRGEEWRHIETEHPVGSGAPAVVHKRAVAAWLCETARWSAHVGLGSRWLPLYSRLHADGAAHAARFHLRTCSRIFSPSPERAVPLGNRGFPWYFQGCYLCMSGASAGGADPAMDVWHVVAACPAVELHRRAAFDRAISRAAGQLGGKHAALVAPLTVLRDSPSGDAQRQVFVMLATLGEALVNGDVAPGRLSPAAAACLSCPAGGGRGEGSRGVVESAAAVVALPAFGSLAAFLARPAPVIKSACL